MENIIGIWSSEDNLEGHWDEDVIFRSNGTGSVEYYNAGAYAGVDKFSWTFDGEYLEYTGSKYLGDSPVKINVLSSESGRPYLELENKRKFLKISQSIESYFKERMERYGE